VSEQDSQEEQDFPDIEETQSPGIGGRELILLALLFGGCVGLYFFFDSLESDDPSNGDSLDLVVQPRDVQEAEAADTSFTPPSIFLNANPVVQENPQPEVDIDQLLLNRSNQTRDERRRAEEAQRRRSATSAVFVGSNEVGQTTRDLNQSVLDLFGSDAAITDSLINQQSDGAVDQTPQTPQTQQQDPSQGFLSIPTLRHSAVNAAVIDNLSWRVLQGTLIHFVLETAINSSLPGLVRGLTTSDVFSADGKRILIPKNSQIIGEYRSGVQRGEARVFVIWTRLITPHGIDVALDSPSTDSLGRAGLSGKADTHFFQRFGGSIFLSIIGGAAQEEAENDVQRQEYANSFNNSAAIALENSIDIPPTVNVKRATVGYVFVARDIDFEDAIKVVSKRIASEQRPAKKRQDETDMRLRKERAEALDRRLKLEQKEAEAVAEAARIQAEFIQNCSNIVLEKERMLSIVVSDYLDRCNAELISWNVSSDKQQRIDFQISETIRVTLPNQLNSLQQFLIDGYRVRLTRHREGVYSATQASSGAITISTQEETP